MKGSSRMGSDTGRANCSPEMGQKCSRKAPGSTIKSRLDRFNLKYLFEINHAFVVAKRFFVLSVSRIGRTMRPKIA